METVVMRDEKTVLSKLLFMDGAFYWIDRVNSRVAAGAIAGSPDEFGYTYVAYKRRKYAAHRLSFLLYYGWLPEEVDHIDGNPRNNAPENLRPATHVENMRNAKMRKDNTSGIKNVYWHKKNKTWVVRLSVNGRQRAFGSFKNIKDAERAAIEARQTVFKDFARHG
jgi:hypothetical protein